MPSNQFVIFCDNPSNKHGKKHPYPVVQGFVYRGDGHDDDLGLGWTDANTSKRLRNAQAHIDASQALIGDEKFDYRNAEHKGKQHRESWTLACKKCGYAVAIVHEKLYPAMSRLHAMGVDRLGLGEIERGLKGTRT